jgi:hypothetical protein
MAYDAIRRVTVLFGSYDTQTWEWDGIAWVLGNDGGPLPRSGGMLVYDSGRGVIVLFGGYYYAGNGQYLGDTWEWDGNDWALRSTTGPSPRAGHSMSTDSGRGVTVLFGGGSNGNSNSETWEWGGSAWLLRTSIGPSPRSGTAMVYDSMRGVTVLFGGQSSGFRSDETWEWDGNAWSQRCTGRERKFALVSDPLSSCDGPSARQVHAMAYDSERHVTVLFGGWDDDNAWNRETWEWNGIGWAQRSNSGPSGRWGHAMAYDANRGVVVLFGGYAPLDFPSHNDQTWEWDGNAWLLGSRAPSIRPSPRKQTAMAYDSVRGVAVLFGGDGPVSGGNIYRGDTWEYAYSEHCGTGDFNGDNAVTTEDIPSFVSDILSPPGTCTADMNGDVKIDGRDLRLFIDALTP